jgi:hypothetical protein
MDPSLIAAGVTVCGSITGVITIWIRFRTCVHLYRTRVGARSEVIRVLAPGSRFIERADGIIIEIGHSEKGHDDGAA